MSLKIQEFELKSKKIIVVLSSIIALGYLIRLYFFPYDLPIGNDGLLYFTYAIDTMILGELPKAFTIPNNGWPILLSGIFPFFNFDTAIEFMTIQRFISITFSVFTIIPIYFISRKFFNPTLSILSCSIFIFEPRLIENSLLGLTEPVYIFLITASLALFLSTKEKIIYFSFSMLAFAAMIRYEAIILLLPFSIIFLFRFRKQGKKIIPKYFFLILIFLLLILPVGYIRHSTTGQDGFTHVMIGPKYVMNTSTSPITDSSHKPIHEFLFDGIFNLIKFLGWSSIPTFVLFLPVGIIIFLKKLDYKKSTLLLTSIFLLLPAFYAYSRNIEELRYLLPIYPILCITSIFFIDYVRRKIPYQKTILIFVFSGIIISSVVFLDYKLPDYETERESLQIARYIFQNTVIINDLYPSTAEKLIFMKLDQTTYPALSIDSALRKNIKSEWPSGKLITLTSHPDVKITKESNNIPNIHFDSVEDYLKFTKKLGLTHIVSDGKTSNPKILNDIFFNEDDFPYLIKEFDSKKLGYSYHMKVFKIDYKNFDYYLSNE
tara:strand:- start:502 stop:2139 length:1638 start_codon:yes stop_codon:yes gene_type:complete